MQPSNPCDQPTVPTTRAEAVAALCVAPNAPLAVAEAAYRVLSKNAHPDAGGSVAAMARLNAAIDLIRTTPTSTALATDCRRRPVEALQWMPWGKFRGAPMAEVPVSYLGWLLDNVDDAAVKVAARRVLHWRVAA